LDSLDKFLEFRINQIIADQNIPIDLAAVCAQIGAVIEEREMVPEAAMQVTPGLFRIYIQSNFAESPGWALRRRFSLAHELGHTLFYERQNGELRPRKDAPRGDGLEAACHQAASMILVPSKVLKVELKNQQPASANDIIMLAHRFEVSTEVMLRRLNQFAVFEHGWTLVLARRRSIDTLAIEYAVHPPWLQVHLSVPTRGTSFNQWFRGIEQADGVLVKETTAGILKASPLKLTGSLVIFEIRIQSE
jgi:hypothetical protein